MTSNCIHFPNADDLCLVCPIVFDWRPLESIPHTYGCMVAGVAVGLYEQPSDKSHWITMRGPAGTQFPSEPKRFPDRTSAEQWATDTLRLVFMARERPEMTPDEPKYPTDVPPVETPPVPEPVPVPGQIAPEPTKDPNEPNVPGPEFESDDEDVDEDYEDFEDEDCDDDDE